jgi:hypothetical protein
MKKPINTDNLVRDYLAGKSLRQLSEKFNLGIMSVRARLVGRGVTIRGAFKKPVITAEMVDSWVADYQAGKTVRDIVKESGCDPHTISDKLKERNVEFRTRAEYTKIGKGRVSAERFPEGLIDRIVSDYQAGKTVVEISRDTGVNVGTIYNRLAEREVTRTGSDASQMRYSTTDAAYRKRITAAAHKANVGRVHPPEELEALRGLGYTIIPQRALGSYNLDIGLEECRVSVEVQSGWPYSFLGAKPALKRLKYVLGQGWSILFVAIRGEGFIFPGIVQKVLTFCDLAGGEESPCGQYGVVRSDGKRFTKKCPNPDGFSRIPGF